MHIPEPEELVVQILGPCRFPSPLGLQPELFVGERSRVFVSADTEVLEPRLQSNQPLPAFEVAGPRAKIFFDPRDLTCGIVTCGGLCPGLNNVIRAIVSSKSSHEPLQLTMEVVDRIHDLGGTILGSSRGPQDVGDMVDTLVQRKVGILFTIGGDGTLRGASAISQEIERRRLPISVIGISKTIDNDLEWTTRSFGFATAVQAADAVIVGAHTEALGVWNGVGLVKLMGRHSGFIAAHASLANSDVNFCLVPVTRTGRALTTAGRGR
jgi:6-phosphofructokinase 1